MLNVFAEAINTEVHSDRLKEIGIQLNIDVNDTITEIEKNIQWMLIKVPEIDTWFTNGAINLSQSITTITFSIALMIFIHY